MPTTSTYTDGKVCATASWQREFPSGHAYLLIRLEGPSRTVDIPLNPEKSCEVVKAANKLRDQPGNQGRRKRWTWYAEIAYKMLDAGLL